LPHGEGIVPPVQNPILTHNPDDLKTLMPCSKKNQKSSLEMGKRAHLLPIYPFFVAIPFFSIR
jgi:hypothetical protein